MIERLTADHAPLLFDLLREPALYRFIPDHPPASVAALEERFRRLSRGAPPGRGEIWLNWILREITGGHPIGTLQATVIPAQRRASVAYLVRADRWRQGLGREACAWLLDHLAAAGAVSLLEARIDVRNLASQRLIESLGFEVVAVVPTTDLGHPSEDRVYQLSLTA